MSQPLTEKQDTAAYTCTLTTGEQEGGGSLRLDCQPVQSSPVHKLQDYLRDAVFKIKVESQAEVVHALNPSTRETSL